MVAAGTDVLPDMGVTAEAWSANDARAGVPEKPGVRMRHGLRHLMGKLRN